MPMTERLPEVGQRVLLRQHGSVYVEGELKENKARTPEGDCLGSPLYLTSEWCSFEREATEWCPMPMPVSDPRWKPGRPVPDFDDDMPSEGESVLTYGRMRDAPDTFWVSLTTATSKKLPFPGFAGGPMVRYEGVLGWMRASEAMDTPLAIPRQILEGESWLEAEKKMKQRLERELAEHIALAIINEHALYQRHFVPLMNGQVLTVNRFKVHFTDYRAPSPRDPVDRKHLVALWCADIVRQWMTANPNLWDGEGLSHHERFQHVPYIAACGVLEHYSDELDDYERKLQCSQ